MKKKRERMTEDRLNAFLDGELRQIIGFGDGGDEVSDERTRNLEYYLNRPLGDEEDGKSKLQSSDVQDVVETLLPALLSPFISSDKAVEFKPVSKEDEEFAELAGLYVNHIFMVDNDGMKTQFTWAKDGLISKNGFVYADWMEKERTAVKFQRVDYAGLDTLAQDAEIEVMEYTAFDGMGNGIDPKMLEQMMAMPDATMFDGMVFEVKYRRTWKEGRVKVENIPPEYLIVSKTAKDCDTARIIGWQEQVTISSLREEGYEESKLENITFSDESEADTTGERFARQQSMGGVFNDNEDNNSDPSSLLVWRTVLWTRVDYDGDGKAELRKIIRAGSKSSGGTILFNEEADEVQIVSFTPVPMPHQLFGRALADLAVQIQDGKTSMLRAAMDATYHTVHPRWKFMEELANENTWDDLMMDIPGAPVRMDGDAVQPLRDSPDIGASYQMLEYLDRMREIRTPVSRQDTGVNADALNDQSATQAQIQANASAMRKELILRIYAESLGKVFKLINRLVIKNQDKPRLLRLYPDREPIDIDPRFWNADMDVSVRVGLGTGTKDQQLQSLMTISQLQMSDLQMGLPTVDVEKLYNTRARIVEFSGLSSPELYFNDPKSAQQPEQQQPQDDPQHQAEMQHMQQQAYEQGKAEGVDQTKLQMKQMELETNSQLKREEIQTNAQVKMVEIGQKAQAEQMQVIRA